MMALRRLEKTGLLLPDTLAAFIEELVAKGAYATESDVIVSALWEMRQRSIPYKQIREELKEDILEGLEDVKTGRTKSLEEVLCSLPVKPSIK